MKNKLHKSIENGYMLDTDIDLSTEE